MNDKVKSKNSFQSDLINKKEKEHHDHKRESSHSHEYEVKFYLWKLIVGSLILLFTLLTIFNAIPNYDSEDWVAMALASVIMLILGYDYIYTAFMSLKTKTISVNLLVTISILSSYFYSLIVLIFFDAGFLLFDATIEVAVIIYYGKYLEEFLSKRVNDDINSLLDIFKKPILVLRDNKEVKISVKDLIVGDLIVVYPGEKIVTDGIVWKGETLIDESTFTGEKVPRFRKKGDFVYGGTIVREKLIVKANVLPENSIISNIVKKINEAKNAKPKSQKISDQIAKYLIPSVLLIALISLAFYSIFGAFSVSITVFVTILVVACPCSFSMITPMCILVSNSSSTKKNIILNSKTIFENITNVNVIAFDKTGTLTTGNFIVTDTSLDDQKIKLLVSAESKYNHPIAQSIVNHFSNLELDHKIKTEGIEGKGLHVIENNGKESFIGSLSLLQRTFKDYLENQELATERKNGSVIIYFFDQQEIFGYVILKDEIRAEARAVIDNLKQQAIVPYLITGDNKLNAEYVSSMVGIKDDHLFSEVLPEEKYKVVKELQEDGKKVIFVGDGINDSVALQQADVGISMGTSSDIAIQSSDITIQNNDLEKILLAISFSKATIYTIYFGFAIAILYNIVMIPLAIAGIFGPAIGATSMALNDTMALLIALSLRRLKFKKVSKLKK